MKCLYSNTDQDISLVLHGFNAVDFDLHEMPLLLKRQSHLPNYNYSSSCKLKEASIYMYTPKGSSNGAITIQLHWKTVEEVQQRAADNSTVLYFFSNISRLYLYSFTVLHSCFQFSLYILYIHSSTPKLKRLRSSSLKDRNLISS